MKQTFFILALSCILFVSVINSCNSGEVLADGSSMPDSVSYNFNIRPILSDKCYACHGPDANKRKAHLRLDIADSAYVR